jgi:hypothetical protein
MVGRPKWLIMIPAIILIPIFLGMPPLNFLHKLGSGCIFHQDKQVQKCSPSSLNSQISPDDYLLANQLFVSLGYEALSSLYPPTLNPNLKPSPGPQESVPLRC